MYKEISSVNFPSPKNINVNMMPFIFGDMSSLPEEFKGYKNLLDSCNLEKGKIAYLTITESLVSPGQTQRRGGIHIESPRGLSWGGGIGWGGMMPDTGLYMASNDGACNVWNEIVEERDHFGACQVNSKAHKMKESTLYWMTDKTPHQALPSVENTMRQFFRVVSHDVTAWFSQHNTPNPKGILPNCEIITRNKFAV